jgi:ribosomal protein S14
LGWLVVVRVLGELQAGRAGRAGQAPGIECLAHYQPLFSSVATQRGLCAVLSNRRGRHCRPHSAPCTLQSVSLSDGSGAFRSPINPGGHECQQRYNANSNSNSNSNTVSSPLGRTRRSCSREAQPPQRGDWPCRSCTHPPVHMAMPMLSRGSLRGPAETVQTRADPRRPVVQAVQTVVPRLAPPASSIEHGAEGDPAGACRQLHMCRLSVEAGWPWRGIGARCSVRGLDLACRQAGR